MGIFKSGIAGILLVLAVFSSSCEATPAEEKIYGKLLNYYHRGGRPGNDGSPAQVAHYLMLHEILDYDFDKDLLTIDVVENCDWEDKRLSWNHTEHKIDKMIFRSSILWLPDITPYNGWRIRTEPSDPSVSHSGILQLYTKSVIQLPCTIKEKHAECSLKVGSWNYDGLQLNLTASEEIDVSDFHLSPRYDLVESSIERNIWKYDCCPEPYIYISYNFKIGFKKRDLSFLDD